MFHMPVSFILRVLRNMFCVILLVCYFLLVVIIILLSIHNYVLFFSFGATVMLLVDSLSARYLQFQEKCLYGEVAFIIKIVLKSLSNVSYLLPAFTGDEIIGKILIITIIMPWVSYAFEV